MAKPIVPRTLVVEEEREAYVHVANAPDLIGAPPLTLCGWYAVPYKEVVEPVTCPACLKIVSYCKSISFPYQEVTR